MSLDLTQLEDDAKEQTANQAARFSLEELVKIGEELEQLKAKADEVAAKLDSYNDEIRRLETETLPDGLKNLGIKTITLSSGAKIALIDIISASITDENRVAAHDWLRTHDHGDIIKNNVIVSFGKGEDHYAEKLVEYLIKIRDEDHIRFGDLVQKEAVHPSTLKAFVKEQLSKGGFPGELFKLYTGQAVKMTR
jgi:hypothetical protein